MLYTADSTNLEIIYQNSFRDPLDATEMTKSCWSLPPEAGSPGEDAAALQAILNGYLAAVPKRNPAAVETGVHR